MPGTALAVGVMAAVAAVTLGLGAVSAASVYGQRLAGAADAAALAAADAASGAVTGVPCERADEVAAASGVVVSVCDVDALVATVTVSGGFGVFTATARARAGPAS
ncbi:Rv3654c family TadE-like protein [Microbacterium sp. SSM24]|uniref:Rv3654c family TadE-like protein n=1 Tax=Microbacterium sp. SSM24 TaxID=2991714 RepID=UPI0022277610|nr:Rv3654c family TadE-like protein [Microbacterium sp. SSM24]MCW3492058.1 helicase [Microbacterium sp. SSM24]